MALACAFIALCFAQPSISPAGPAPGSPAKSGNLTRDPCAGHKVTASQVKPFTAKVWDLDKWKRGRPPRRVLTAHRRQLRCAAGPGHRKAIRHFWRSEKKEFRHHRKAMLWRERVTPFYGCTPYGCGWFALPVLLVICESSGNYHFPYGAYSILDPAWHAWGGKTAHAGEASKREQDRVAHYGYIHYGTSPWECGIDGEPHPF